MRHKFPEGNPGKPKGAKNKRTIDAEKRVEFVLSILEETLQDDIEAMDPTERVKLWNGLQEYIRPKLARTELTGAGGQPLSPISKVEIIHTNEDSGQPGSK